jgi:uncharacterized membrane protein YhaH (DUF805 family)
VDELSTYNYTAIVWGLLMDAWYYAENGQPKGPLTLERLCDHMLSAREAERLLVWRHGLDRWREARELPQFEPFIARPPPVPSASEAGDAAVPASLFTAFFGFDGRIGRTEYVTVLAASIVALLVGFVGATAFSDKEAGQAVLVVVALTSTWVKLAASCKRFHDLNRSGLYCLLYVVPIINVMVFFYLIFGRGDSGDNDYGRPLKYFLK